VLRDIREAGVSEGTFRVADRAIATMCEYVFLWFKHGGPYSVEEVGDLYAELSLAVARGAHRHPIVGIAGHG
jgi:hypothetical protein